MDDANSAIEAATHVMKMQGMNQPHTIAKCPPNGIHIRTDRSVGFVSDLLEEGKNSL